MSTGVLPLPDPATLPYNRVVPKYSETHTECRHAVSSQVAEDDVAVRAGPGRSDGFRPAQSPNVKIPEISERINAFTLDLLKRYAQGDAAEQNAILSPQCIFHGLAMSYVASGGETRKELARTLHFPDDDQKLMKDLANLRRDLEATAKHKRTKVTVANAVWLDSTYAEFRKDYKEKLEKGFSASLRSTKFGNGAEASREINQWVSDKTHGKITKTVGPDDFKSRSGPGVVNEPALVSVNAVYFKADWGSRFEKGATRDGPFHVNAATTENTPMMHQHSLLPYAENEEFKFLGIPYIDGQYSMYVLLPWKVLGVKELMSHVTARTVIDLKRSSAGRTVTSCCRSSRSPVTTSSRINWRTWACPAPSTRRKRTSTR